MRPSAGTWRREGVASRGTRFLLFPQAPISAKSRPPEIVTVSPPAGSVRAGPQDARMYVADARDKREPYDPPYMPPYRGRTSPPVPPGPGGHFDHLRPGTRAFMAAHMYGTVRLVLDIWEHYFGGEIPWHFSDELRRLELVPMVKWDNAQCGYGFIETGFARGRGWSHPFCLDFDVLAHELGHAFIYALLGIPPEDELAVQYLAFHESAADCTAMIAVLHFDSVVDDLLVASRGNLYLPNELNRIGELSDTEQLRSASHSLTMADVPDVDTPLDRLDQPDRHTIGLPLTGGVFDLLVEVFQEILVEEGLIDATLDVASRQEKGAPEAEVQVAFDRAYAGRHDAFKAALLDARDYVGRLLAGGWRRLDWNVTFADAVAAILAADDEISGGVGHGLIRENFGWRGILPPPAAAPPPRAERVASARW